ncbi:LutC/YkgG family protein [Kaarinaea lacus]
MSDARDNILQRIRLANQKYSQVSATDIQQQHMQQRQRGPQPHWQENLLTRFTQKVEQAAASYEQVKTDQEIVRAVEAYLARQSPGEKIVRAGTPLLNRLDWPEDMVTETRAATIQDKVVLVEAFAGIAETGSIVMCSAKETPVSLNFLPDYFLCVVHISSIVLTIEDVWEKIRTQGEAMPRAINIITGPSRTADVEQVIQMGAHGPRQVHLLLQD